MRNYYFLLTALFLFSCQDEENTVIRNNDAALTKTSPLSSLVLRVSQNPTHWDNILDNSDCFSVKLPVSIVLNNQNMTISDENDLNDVLENMEDSSSDDDIVHFNFPIVVVYRNFIEQTVGGQAQLDAISCPGDNFNEIRCLDFVYPIHINTYDTNNQVANTISLQNDSEVFNFVTGLTTEQIFTIVYPVNLTLASGGLLSVANNNELEQAIESSIGVCDNVGPNPGPMELEAIMTSGTWYISYLEDDSSGSGSGQQQNYYDGYDFTFLNNGSVIAVKNGVTSFGTWELYEDSHQMIELFFPTAALQGLTNDEWRVIEYNQTNFRLKNDQGGSWDGHEYIYFTKN